MRATLIANTLFTAALLVNTGYSDGGAGWNVLARRRRANRRRGADGVREHPDLLHLVLDHRSAAGVIGEEPDERPLVFRFPQRAATLPGYEKWSPHYSDYLLLAFTTNVAFSPTDAAPLTRRQAADSIVGGDFGDNAYLYCR